MSLLIKCMYIMYRFPIFNSWSKQSGDAGDNTIVPDSQSDVESNESETGTTDDNLTTDETPSLPEAEIEMSTKRNSLLKNIKGNNKPFRKCTWYVNCK